MKLLEQIIQYHFNETSASLPITYSCHTTHTNHAQVISHVGLFSYTDEDDKPKRFLEMLENVVTTLQEDFPNIHLITRNTELHFLYHGFNSCCHHTLPIEISVRDASEEPVKTGKISESYKQVGGRTVLNIIRKHPTYEIYMRTGFAYRGAKERKTTDMDAIQRTLDWMACADVDVIDNEIHINAFSANDMW